MVLMMTTGDIRYGTINPSDVNLRWWLQLTLFRAWGMMVVLCPNAWCWAAPNSEMADDKPTQLTLSPRRQTQCLNWLPDLMVVSRLRYDGDGCRAGWWLMVDSARQWLVTTTAGHPIQRSVTMAAEFSLPFMWVCQSEGAPVAFSLSKQNVWQLEE